MLFNSIDFLLFFPLVTAIYFLLPHRVRWVWLLIASYYFYMSWNVKYALLIVLSTLTTYAAGLLIRRAEAISDARRRVRWKKLWVFFGFAVNLSILFFFKYFNFFLDNLSAALALAGLAFKRPAFDVVLPVGISFYTFQALSYTVDIYRGEVEPERNPFRYALFVSFFPQLVAGPIERSRNLMGQLYERHDFDPDRVRDGLLLMLWGMLEKIVVADRLALLVDYVYDNYAQLPGAAVALATVFFAFQIYCDFAGYSHIAIGAAQVMGFTLMENFRRPYLAQSAAEFWRRWHISLGTWFREYLYIPLGGNRVSKPRLFFNLLVVWAATGIWHGASWNFLIWGLYFAVLLILEKAFLGKLLQKLPAALQHLYTLFLVLVSWAIFAVEDFGHMGAYLKAMFGLGGGLTNDNVSYYFFSFLPMLIIAAVASTPLAAKLWKRLPEKPRLALLPILLLAGLVFSTAYLVDATYNPFLYFRF